MSYFKNALEAISNHLPSLSNRKNNFSTSPERVKYKKIGNYVLLSTIGTGTFSKVKLGVHIPTQQKVAIKILDKSLIKDESDIKRITREIHILTILRHPNIAQLYETIPSERHIYIIMEYVDGNDLFKYINNKERLSEIKASQFFRQLISCLEYIHTLGIVHRDIKPENILLNLSHDNLKLVDFGLSNSYKHGTLLKTACGSPCYAAPEMISGKEYDGLYSDLWSCGVVLYCMLTGKLPFDDENIKVLYHNIKTANYVMPLFLSEISKDIIKRILTTNPKQRISLNQIKQHPFFLLAEKICKLNKGIVLGIEDIPLDKEIVLYMKKKYYNKQEEITTSYIEKIIAENNHNNMTSIYYLLLKNKDKINLDEFPEKNTDEIISRNENHFSEDCKTENKILKNEARNTELTNNTNESIEKISKKENKSNENQKNIYDKNNNITNIQKIFNVNNITKINFDIKGKKEKDNKINKEINVSNNINNVNGNRYNVVVINNIMSDSNVKNDSNNTQCSQIKNTNCIKNQKKQFYDLQLNVNKLINNNVLNKSKNNSRNKTQKLYNLSGNKRLATKDSVKTETTTYGNINRPKSTKSNQLEYSLGKIRKINYKCINLNPFDKKTSKILTSNLYINKRNNITPNSTNSYFYGKDKLVTKDRFISGDNKRINSKSKNIKDIINKKIQMKRIFNDEEESRSINLCDKRNNNYNIRSINLNQMNLNLNRTTFFNQNKEKLNEKEIKLKIKSKERKAFSFGKKNNNNINEENNIKDEIKQNKTPNNKNKTNNNALENTISKIFKDRFNISLKKNQNFILKHNNCYLKKENVLNKKIKSINNKTQSPCELKNEMQSTPNEKIVTENNSNNKNKINLRAALNFSNIIKKSLSKERTKKDFYRTVGHTSKEKEQNNVKKIEILKQPNLNSCKINESTKICQFISTNKLYSENNNLSINSVNSSGLNNNSNNINNKNYVSEIDALNSLKNIIYKHKSKRKTVSLNINLNNNI